ncbi:hypothetical protein BBK36DRAFT_1118919 [Trichoderma citrinoviride]|uniref:Transmembrane protein n=1 Tax=Trichoderma citrinoviride TaxID=58853 RepID=A0A2T4BAC8_9HYPO|nr:hypothetical protein BBK36DRAFT_1118919 [Trichoderma citrinoviride]PTB66277.1 hypothetical protein BBK36DRAFT_1118919 [Trichoderma citrinoviride]
MSSLPEDIGVRDYLAARFFPGLAPADEATATESRRSPSGSPEPQLPAYDDDRPPPKYRTMEELALEDEEEERRTIAQQKRVLLVRLLSFLFCVSIVVLVVAVAIVQANRTRKRKEMELEYQQEVNETSSGLRGPAVDEGLVVSLTAIVFARASTGNATAVPFTA